MESVRQLQGTLDSVAEHATFELGGRELSSGQFRDLLARRAQTTRAAEEAKEARVVVPDDLLTQLTDHVRADLREYIEPSTERIGHAFPVGGGAPGQASHPTMTHERDGIVSFEAASHVETFAAALAGARP